MAISSKIDRIKAMVYKELRFPMKRCPYCGKMHQDEEVRCAVDQASLVYAKPQSHASTPALKHITLGSRDKKTYGMLALLVFVAGILSIYGFKFGESLGCFSIVYAILYASGNGHLTSFTFRNGEIVEKLDQTSS